MLDEFDTSFLPISASQGTAATVLTKPGHVVGTSIISLPRYSKVNANAADIYALGCVTTSAWPASPSDGSFVEATGEPR